MNVLMSLAPLCFVLLVCACSRQQVEHTFEYECNDTSKTEPIRLIFEDGFNDGDKIAVFVNSQMIYSSVNATVESLGRAYEYLSLYYPGGVAVGYGVNNAIKYFEEFEDMAYPPSENIITVEYAGMEIRFRLVDCAAEYVIKAVEDSMTVQLAFETVNLYM